MRRFLGILLLFGLCACTPNATAPSPTPASQKPASTKHASSKPTRWAVSDYVTGLTIPWDMALATDGRLFFTERPGTVSFVKDGVVTKLSNGPDVTSSGESGLTGITLHPDFPKTADVYLYYSYNTDEGLRNRVSRFTLSGTTLGNERFIVTDLPGGQIHNGGRMRFGPDGMLWILTGESGVPNLAQDSASLGGKVLRVTEDGAVPKDNPRDGSPIYSIGHRNPQGIDWDGRGWPLVSEHGQTAHDEINVILPGANYAWPIEQECDSDDDAFMDPVACSGTTTWAPSGIGFLPGSDGPRQSLIVAGLRGNFVKRFEWNGKTLTDAETIVSDRGRMRGVLVAPDGTIYVTTSNRDGRGAVQPGDDRILKITKE